MVEINGMKLTEPSQAYQVLWESFTGSKVASNQAMELLAKRFSSPSANRQPWYALSSLKDDYLVF